MINTDMRIAALERLVQEQAERIRHLEGQLCSEFQAPPEWGLPRREEQIFGMLLARPRVSKQAMLTMFYQDDDVAPEVIESHVSKLRKRLAPFGISIESERHLGYRLIGRERYRQVTA